MPASTVKITGDDIILPIGGLVDGIDVGTAVPAAQTAADDAQTDATQALSDAAAALSAANEADDTADAAQTTANTHASRHKGDGADPIFSTTITEATTARTLALTDASEYIRCTSGSATAVTVPKNSVVAFPVDTEIAIRQAGAGAVTLTPVDGDVTLNPPAGGTLVTGGQGATVVIKKVATDVWDVVGKTT